MEEKGISASKTSLIPRNGYQVTAVQRCLLLLNSLFYQIMAVLTVAMFWMFFQFYPLDELRLWHLVLSTAAYVPLMAAAIILFSEDNTTTLHIPRTKRYTIHGILLAVSCTAVTVGIVLEINAKQKDGRPHFVSNHAILGLVSWVLMFVSMIIGLMAANTRTFSFLKPVLIKLVHNVLGLGAFAIGIGSLFEMLTFFRNAGSETIYRGVYVCLVYVTIWSCLAAVKSLGLQVKGVFT